MDEEIKVGRSYFKKFWVFSLFVIIILNVQFVFNEEVLGDEQIAGPLRMDLFCNEINNRTVKPGYFASVNVSLNSYDDGNHGEQFYNLSVNINRSGWKVMIDTPPDMGSDNPGFIRIQGNGSKSFQVLVYAPFTGPFRETANITISARNSVNNSIIDSISIIFTVDHFLDFQLQYLKQASTDPLDPHVDKKWDGIDPGADGLYTISILNKGNVNDTYELTLGDPPAGTGWNWYFFETGSLTANVSLSSSNMIEEYGGSSGSTFTIVVKCPLNTTANDEFQMVLNGISVRSKSPQIENITRSDTLILIVGKVTSLKLSCDDPIKYVIPNGTIVIYLNITHLGNQAAINVILSIEGKQPGWKISYQEEPITIYQGQTKQVPIRITAPGYVGMHPDFEMTIIGMVQGYSDDRGAAKVTVYLLEPIISQLTLGFPPLDGIIIGPGEVATVNLDVKNSGNTNETVNITIEDREEFPFSISIDPVDAFIEFLPGQFNTLRCNISIRTFLITPPGDYHVTFMIRSENCSRSAVFKVHVLEMKGLRIGSTYSGQGTEEIHIGPGIGYLKEFYIENTGNGIVKVNPSIGIHKIIGSIEGSITPMDWLSSVMNYGKNEQRISNSTRVTTSNMIELSDLTEKTMYNLQGRPSLEDLTIILHGQDIIWLTVHIEVPDNDGLEPVGSRNISIGVLNGTGVLKDMIHMQFNIQYSDIEFQIISISSEGAKNNLEFMEGEEIQLSVYIKNIGFVHSSMTDVIIRINGNIFAIIGVDPLDPSEVYHFTDYLFLNTGVHNVTLELDPSNYVFESNDQFMSNSKPGSNLFSEEIRVRGMDQDELDINWIMVFSILLTFFIFLGVMIFIAFKVKKDLPEE